MIRTVSKGAEDESHAAEPAPRSRMAKAFRIGITGSPGYNKSIRRLPV